MLGGGCRKEGGKGGGKHMGIQSSMWLVPKEFDDDYPHHIYVSFTKLSPAETE